MNPPPVPTPYDILPPPSFPYEPGAFDWILLFLCSSIIILFLRKKAGQKNSKKDYLHYASLLYNLTKEDIKSDDQNYLLTSTTKITRRFLEDIYKYDCSTLSIEELITWSNKLPLRTQKICNLLKVIDDARFSNTNYPTEDLKIKILEIREDIISFHNDEVPQ